MKWFIVLFFVIQSCAGIKHFTNQQGFERPNNYKFFKYTKYTTLVVDGIDTNAVYIQNWINPNTKESYYRYYRFLPNGRVLYNYDSLHLPKINNSEYGNIGYYYCKNNKLKLEIFKVTYGIRGSIVKEFGYVSKDTIKLYLQNPATFNNNYKLTAKGALTDSWVKLIPTNLKPVIPFW